MPFQQVSSSFQTVSNLHSHLSANADRDNVRHQSRIFLVGKQKHISEINEFNKNLGFPSLTSLACKSLDLLWLMKKIWHCFPAISTTRKPRRLFNVEKRGVKQQGIKPSNLPTICHHLRSSGMLLIILSRSPSNGVSNRS